MKSIVVLCLLVFSTFIFARGESLAAADSFEGAGETDENNEMQVYIFGYIN
jgi:hypothetical protein